MFDTFNVIKTFDSVHECNCTKQENGIKMCSVCKYFTSGQNCSSLCKYRGECVQRLPKSKK